MSRHFTKADTKVFMERRKAFLEKLGMELHDADPIMIASEAAIEAVYVRRGLDAEHTGQRALKNMPANSTKFERGLAMGLALAMIALDPSP